MAIFEVNMAIDAAGYSEQQKPRFDITRRKFRIQGYLRQGPCCSATLSLSEIAILALFIIGCIGASGAFPGSMSIGWTAVGVGSGLAVLSVCAGNLRGRKLKVLTSALMAATLITVGALGGAGILSATQVSWAIVGTVLVSIPIRYGICRYHSRADAQLMRRLTTLRATPHDESSSSSSSSTSSTSGSHEDGRGEATTTGVTHEPPQHNADLDDAVEDGFEVVQADRGRLLRSQQHSDSYAADLTTGMATALDGSVGPGPSHEEQIRALDAQIKAQKAKVRKADEATAKARLDMDDLRARAKALGVDGLVPNSDS